MLEIVYFPQKCVKHLTPVPATKYETKKCTGSNVPLALEHRSFLVCLSPVVRNFFFLFFFFFLGGGGGLVHFASEPLYFYDSADKKKLFNNQHHRTCSDC